MFLMTEDGSYLLNEDGSKIALDEAEHMADPIDLITANPNTANPASFATEADLAWAQLKDRIPQMNAALMALRLVSVTDVSATSHTISEGQKTFTISAGKSFLAGQYLTIADTAAPADNSMLAQIESYSGTTLKVKVKSAEGSGTKASWTISLASKPLTLHGGASLLILSGGNGTGSTYTTIRRFTTVVTNTSEDVNWSYEDDAAFGGKITILSTGIYQINYDDAQSGTADIYIAKNAVSGVASTINKLFIANSEDSHDAGNSICTYLAAGDFLNAFGGSFTSSQVVRLRIERIL